MKTASEPGRISTAQPAALPRQPTISTGRRPRRSAKRPARIRAAPFATVNTVNPMPVTIGLRCSASTTNSGTIADRTPSEAQLSARFATAAARNAGSRTACAIGQGRRRRVVGAPARMWRGSSSNPDPPAAASVPA